LIMVERSTMLVLNTESLSLSFRNECNNANKENAHEVVLMRHLLFQEENYSETQRENTEKLTKPAPKR
jgi:hypothetical protein